MRRPMVAGNWKMHGTRASVAELIKGLSDQVLPSGVDVAVFPPSLFINQVIDGLEGKSIAVGAQNSAVEPQQGALTGEVAASQLVDAGCKLVLIGHSERRQILGEQDATLIQKFAAAQSCGLTPVFCVGETLEEREANQTLEVVGRQLDSIIGQLGISAFSNAIIAYEPVWAIGTGLTATPQQAQDVHKAIREQLAAKDSEVARNTRLLYGGSVKAANAAELFGMPDIDGGLIGGASLNADEFGAICRAAGNGKMLETVIVVLHLLGALGLVVLVLLQQGKGAEAGASFGAGASNTVFGSQGSATFLSKFTAILAASFFLTALGLGYFAKEKAHELTQVGLPDPAVMEVQQSKPATDDVPVLQEQKGPAANTSDVPQAPEQK